jgi:uncharacterized protein (TIGR01777 family)
MATVLISGASGFLGSALAQSLQQDGHKLVRLSRASLPDHVTWDPAAGRIDRAALERTAADVVINLAGEPIAQRWTASRRTLIRETRVHGTQALSEAIAALGKKPTLLLNGSAMGFYGAQRGDEILDESSASGQDFLAEVASDWERATEPASTAGVRVASSRTGLVLGASGGMLQRILPPFKAGVGGRLGDGKQWMSCISLEDYVRGLRFIIDTPSVSGPVNLVGPEPVRNDEFTKVLASVLHRPALFPVPRFAMQLVFGEMADNTIFASQRVVPKKLAGAGFEFRHPRLEQALRAELRR